MFGATMRHVRRAPVARMAVIFAGSRAEGATECLRNPECRRVVDQARGE
jgi:hypothetical protein